MKFGFLLLFGTIMLVLCLIQSFFLNGGKLFAKDKDGFMKLKVQGGIDALGWGRALIMAIVTGFFASIAVKSSIGGLIAFVVMILTMVYVTYWSVNEASTIKEVVTFILILIVLTIVANMGAIAMGGVVRHYAWLSIFMTIPGVALTICIVIIIGAVLRYHAEFNPRGLNEDKRKLCSILAIVVVIVGLGIAIYLLANGIKWQGF